MWLSDALGCKIFDNPTCFIIEISHDFSFLYLLVGGLEHVLFFHILGINHPNQFFSEGLKPPTSRYGPFLLQKSMNIQWLGGSDSMRLGVFGVFIFPINSIVNGEPFGAT